MTNKTPCVGVIILQLGAPKSPRKSDVRRFLKQFLGDRRVVDYDNIFWKILLYGYIIPLRPFATAKAYRSIFDGQRFALFKHTENFSRKLQKIADARGSTRMIREAYIIGTPTLDQRIDELVNAGCQHLVFIPQFPQHAHATTCSACDAVHAALRSAATRVPHTFIQGFHDNRAYIETTRSHINAAIAIHKPEKLILSFHGYPLRRIVGGDPYFDACTHSAQLIAEGLKMPLADIALTFQSQFGHEEWLKPATKERLFDMAQLGIKHILVACPAFLVDNLETDEEIAIGLKNYFIASGGESLNVVPCLNDDDQWARAFYDDFISPPIHAIAQNKLTLPVDKTVEKGTILTKPSQEKVAAPLSTQSKTTIKIMFLTLFLDLVGFSIIFPLFPQMLDYYMAHDNGPLLTLLLRGIANVAALAGGASSMQTTVLFGGLLGALYSWMQFLFAPIYGTLSDRLGRRPILLFSLTGILASYILWFFSGTFALLVAARLFGGIMSANISTATAVIADVTTHENRSKGMVWVGIAFGLGFIIGPAIGGISSLLDLSKVFPSAAHIGINPFSMPALIASLLAALNLFLVIARFKETLPPEKRAHHKSMRRLNPITLFSVSEYPGVRALNGSYFLFLTAFSGMEFTLTFLAVKRFQFTPIANASMFIFVGLIIAFIQGGYVRKAAHRVGEKNMLLRGVLLVMPGLACLAFAHSITLLYIALALMALGSAMANPCYTTLVSHYTPATDQGRVLGIFRSVGALSRAVGPLAFCLIYWLLGPQNAYLLGTIFLILPVLLAWKLPMSNNEQQ